MAFSQKLDCAAKLGKHEEDQLVSLATKAGVQQEMLVLIGYFQTKRHFIYGDKRRVKSNAFLQPLLSSDGSLASLLNIYQTYVSTKDHQKRAWCRQRGLDITTLKQIQEYVTKSDKNQTKSTNGTTVNRNKVLCDLLFETFSENLCIYMGHKSLGYIRLKTNKQVTVDFNLCQCVNFPKFVLEINSDSPSKYVNDFISIDEETVNKHIYFGKLGENFRSLLDRRVHVTVIGDVRPDVLHKIELCSKRSDSYIMKEIEKISKRFTSILEADMKNRKLYIYSAKHLLNDMKKKVEELIEKMNKDKNEYRELLHYPTEDSTTQLLVGAGLEVKHVLNPGDAIDVLIIKVPYRSRSQLSEKEVHSALSKHGEVEFIKVFTDEEKRKYGAYDMKKLTWGKARFCNPKAVNKAVSSLEMFPINQSFFLEKVKTNSHYHLKEGIVFMMKLCRRPWIGVTRIKCTKTRKTQQLGLFDESELNIDGHVCHAHSGPNGIEVWQIPHDADEQKLKEAIEEKFKTEVTKITPERLPAMKADPDSYRNFSNLIDRSLANRCHVTCHSVDVAPAEPEDIYMKAKLTIPHDTDVKQFLEDLGQIEYKNQFAMFLANHNNAEYVDIDPDIAMSLHLSHGIYLALREMLEDIKKSTTEEHPTVKVEDNIHSNGDHTLMISSNDAELTKAVYEEFRKLVTPRELPGLKEADFRYLESQDGRQYMRITMKRFSVHIAAVPSRGVLNVYGTPESTQNAVESLTDLIGEHSGITQSFIIDINSFGLSQVSVSEQTKLIQENIEILRQIYGVTYLVMPDGSSVLTLKGSSESYLGVKRKMSSVLRSKFDSGSQHTEELCSACLCPPMEPSFYLSTCSHVYCLLCLKMHLSVAAESRFFPISCVQEGCQQPVAYRDASSVFNCEPTSLQAIISQSVNLYAARNSHIINYCPTPDCSAIYTVTEETQPFRCPLCSSTWCRQCHKAYHGGMPCLLEHLLDQSDVEHTVKDWIKLDPNNRKMCGKCRSGIEKIEGCDNILCTSCNSSVCWKCLQTFSSGADCYEHLTVTHQGLGEFDQFF